ncbi:MAG: hypothetical protein GXP32_06220 [Kiritimatiellaeota bacterium]|nr:hypothetical protein [Kiritimatiellota bacterium]
MKTRLRHILNEVVWCLKTLKNPKCLWIYIPGLVATLSVYLASWAGAGWFLAKGGQETSALVILCCSIALLCLSSAKMKTIAPLFLLVLCVNFLIREMDHQIITIPGYGDIVVLSKHYIYFALVLMGAWGVWKEERILAFFNEHIGVKTVLLSMGMTYVLSQIFARRVFKHIKILPDERRLHIAFEEITENFAHSMFLLAAVLILLIALKSAESKDETRGVS